MCWRWEVSLVSAALEWLCAASLFSRDLPRDKNYAIFMAGIATMESEQLALWLCLELRRAVAPRG